MNTYYKNITGSTMRAGWTMIELIFILIVVGILASIALRKLDATRDDAKLSAAVSNMSICIRDMGTIYTATATNLNDINTSACNNVECFTTEINGSTMKVDINTSAKNYCDDIENVGGHLIRTYDFAGKSIVR